ncbi:MAG: AAA family ATPase, partial [Candidatus Amesbacteria bacterium]|nr:AAA family ATPase [Candidatus Amesbacteria bacterium]
MDKVELQTKTINLLNPWWQDIKIELGIERTNYLTPVIETLTKRQQTLFILGSRRVGKTRILLQTIYRLIQSGVPAKKILFLSLDNTNLEKFDWYNY